MRGPLLAPLLLFSAFALARLSDSDLGRMEDFDAWLQQAFRPEAMKTLEGIRSMGRLRSESRSAYPSAHSDAALEMHEFVLDGLAIYVVAQKDHPARLWPISVEISSASWPLVNGIAVGDPITELASLPVAPDSDSLTFCGVTNCLIAEARDGRITSLRLEFYFD
jgi:hypothetical protein